MPTLFDLFIAVSNLETFWSYDCDECGWSVGCSADGGHEANFESFRWKRVAEDLSI